MRALAISLVGLALGCGNPAGGGSWEILEVHGTALEQDEQLVFHYRVRVRNRTPDAVRLGGELRFLGATNSQIHAEALEPFALGPEQSRTIEGSTDLPDELATRVAEVDVRLHSY